MKSGEKELKKGQKVTVRVTRLSRNPEGAPLWGPESRQFPAEELPGGSSRLDGCLCTSNSSSWPATTL